MRNQLKNVIFRASFITIENTIYQLVMTLYLCLFIHAYVITLEQTNLKVKDGFNKIAHFQVIFIFIIKYLCQHTSCYSLNRWAPKSAGLYSFARKSWINAYKLIESV